MSLSRKIIIFYILLIPLVFVPLGFYLSGSLKDYFIKRLEENLFAQCKILIDQLPYLDKEKNLDELAKQLKIKTNTRVTIILSDGTVLGDSDKPSVSMDNHLQRPEIQQAMLREPGTSIRFSNTVKKHMLYLAIPVWQDNKMRGFLRLAHPMTEIENTLYEIREKIILASFLALTISVIIGLYLSGSITRRIKKIVEVSRDIAMGNLKRKTLIPSEDEIGELEKNLNIMAEELETKMQTLAREKQTLETVFNTMRDGILVIDGKGNIINASPAINRIFGISGDVKGRPYFEILRDPAAQDAMKEARDTRRSAMREIEIFYPTYRYLYITVTPLLSNILGAGSIVVVHDITKIKHLETVRKDFVANVSHELRTPITAIKGFAETLLEGSLEDKKNARRHLEIIKNHSERLNSLVEDLLTLSRLDRGEFHLNPEEVKLREIIDMVFITLKDKAVSKDISLLKEIPEDISVTADRNALTQIFLNLVDNAIKFTEFGRVLIRVESKDDTIEISVEDTGIGIESKHIPRLGERFYRVDSARSRALGGTGLGLAIVKHLVHLHGWQMKINSVPGKGTKVILIIPTKFT